MRWGFAAPERRWRGARERERVREEVASMMLACSTEPEARSIECYSERADRSVCFIARGRRRRAEECDGEIDGVTHWSARCVREGEGMEERST
jgi:hypothetical protein